jgi:hypothetical protein
VSEWIKVDLGSLDVSALHWIEEEGLHKTGVKRVTIEPAPAVASVSVLADQIIPNETRERITMHPVQGQVAGQGEVRIHERVVVVVGQRTLWDHLKEKPLEITSNTFVRNPFDSPVNSQCLEKR